MKHTLSLLAFLSMTNAFSPSLNPRSSSALMAAPSDRREVLSSFLAGTMVVFNAQEASANEGFASSSIELGEAYKTLDMTLPSYGDVKDAKASIENVASLSKEGKRDGLAQPADIMSEESRAAKKAQSALSPKQKKELAAASAATAKSSKSSTPQYDF